MRVTYTFPAVFVYAANFFNFYLWNDTSLSIPILSYHCSLRFSGNQDVSAFPERWLCQDKVQSIKFRISYLGSATLKAFIISLLYHGNTYSYSDHGCRYIIVIALWTLQRLSLLNSTKKHGIIRQIFSKSSIETECNNSVKTQYPLALVLKRKIVCKCPYRLVFIVN